MLGRLLPTAILGCGKRIAWKSQRRQGPLLDAPCSWAAEGVVRDLPHLGQLVPAYLKAIGPLASLGTTFAFPPFLSGQDPRQRQNQTAPDGRDLAISGCHPALFRLVLLPATQKTRKNVARRGRWRANMLCTDASGAKLGWTIGCGRKRPLLTTVWYAERCRKDAEAGSFRSG